MVSDTIQVLLQEAANLYRLQEFVDTTVLGAHKGPRFVLSEQLIRQMHAIAVEQLPHRPGEYRTCPVNITNSPHVCPNWIEVPALMGTLVRYVNDNWDKKSLIHLASFVMWRLNWVHPFENGNGRTARATSYLVLCMKHGGLLPAKSSIVEQISANKQPYYAALRYADDVYAQTQNIDACLVELENLMSLLLKNQLKAAFGS